MSAPRWLRAPALHFAAIGGILFALGRATGLVPGASEPARAPIVVRAAQIEKLLADYTAATGLVPTRDDARALVEGEIETEVLYREALARGFDRGDRGVAWRLVEKMSFLSDEPEVDRDALLSQAAGLALGAEDLVVRRLLVEKMRLRLRHRGSIETPSDADLEAYRLAHAERFRQPERWQISQVFFSRDRPEARAEASALAAAWQASGAPPSEVSGRGDPLPFTRVAWSTTLAELAGRLGAELADAIAQLPVGTWSAPIASTFGWHVVYVHERVAARDPDLAEIRGPVLYGLLAERRDAALVESTRALREAYDVRIEWPASLAPEVAANQGGTRP